MASLPDDYWMHDEATQSLIGKRSRKTFQLAQMLEVRLAEARPVTGGLLFSLVQPPARPRSDARAKSRQKNPASQGAQQTQVRAEPEVETPQVTRAVLIFLHLRHPAAGAWSASRHGRGGHVRHGHRRLGLGRRAVLYRAALAAGADAFRK